MNSKGRNGTKEVLKMSYICNPIEQLERYLKDAMDIYNDKTNEDVELLRKAMVLDSTIKSMNIGEIILPYDWTVIQNCKSRNWDYHDKLLDNIRTISNVIQGKLNENPVYADYCSLRDDIKKGKNLKPKQQKFDFITQMTVKYNDKIDFGKAVQDYIKNGITFPNNNGDALFKGVIDKLQMELDSLGIEKTQKNSKNHATAKTIVNVTQTNAQTVTQVTSFSFNECFQQLDDCESMREKDIKKLKKMLAEIEKLLKDKKGQKKTIRKKIGNVLKWIANKATDTMIAVLPVLLQSLEMLSK